jgi:undecaprenyl-diphosphatase
MNSFVPDDATRADWRRAAWIGAAILVALLIVDGLVVAWMRTGTGLARGDGPVHQAFIAVRTPTMDVVVTGFTNLGQTLPMEIMGVVLCTLLYLRFRRWSIWGLPILTAVGSVSITESAKLLFARPRPPIAEAVPPYETAFAFPSGHTLNSTAIAGIFAYLTVWLARRVWVRVAAVIAAVTWATLMGLSRLFLGHHWLTDVAAGWVTGLAWLVIVVTIHQAATRHDPDLDPGPRPASAAS